MTAAPDSEVGAEPVVHPGDRPSLLPAGGDNAVAHTLSLIGDEWTLAIVREALQDARRYGDWLKALSISNSVLTARLGRLTEMGAMERVEYQSRPRRFEYRLTKRGREVWPVLIAIWAWELKWAQHPPGPFPRMVHRACGAHIIPQMQCAACRSSVEPPDVVGEFGPSGSFARSVPAPATRRRSRPAIRRGSNQISETMELIGNRWSAAVIGAAFQGARRFSEFEARLGAPPTMVADRLRTFRELGVLAPAGDRGAGGPYRLTDKGRAFLPVVMMALDWGQRWFRAPEGPALLYWHRECAAELRPLLACPRCRAVLHHRDIVTDPR